MAKKALKKAQKLEGIKTLLKNGRAA